MLLMRFMKLVQILYTWYNCLGKQHGIKFKFILYLCGGCHQLPKKGRLKALVWFWLIDETYWNNPMPKCVDKLGWSNPSGGG